jgi:glycosyltransferase involved in cell wall biosynthesis
VHCLDAAPAWRRPRSVVAFWRALRAQEPRVLYARLPSDFLFLMGLAARRRPRTRFVYALAHDLHARAWTAYDHRRWFHAPLFALGLHLSHRIVIQHEDQRAALPPALRGRAALVPNIVRSVREAPRPYGQTLHDVAWVAKIRTEKRLDRLFDLADASPGLTFAVIGGFDPLLPAGERADLERRAASTANVAMLGEMRAADVLGTVALSKVLVNTSDAEGFPNTMLEAWSMGVPAVSLSVDPGGVIAREGLGAVSRDPQTLARDVAVLVQDESVNRRAGLAGLAYVRRRHATAVVCRSLADACIPGRPGDLTDEPGRHPVPGRPLAIASGTTPDGDHPDLR